MSKFSFFVIIVFSASVLIGCKSNQPYYSENYALAKSTPAQDKYAPKDKTIRATKPRVIDLLHTKIEIEIDWAAEQLHGVATLQLTPYFYPQSSIVLDAKNMDIKKVVIVSQNGEMDLQFDYNGHQLILLLDKEYDRGQNIVVKVHYSTINNHFANNKGKAIRENRGFYFIDPLATDSLKPTQLWTQGEPEANSNWFPTIDSPNERCTQEIYITVEEQFKTLSNGVLKSQVTHQNGKRTDHWVMDQPHAPYLFMMAIGEFDVIADTVNGIPLTYWVEPEYSRYAKQIFGNTPEMVEYFSKIFNYPYPWPKYSQVVVRDFVSGAMENTTASVFMEDVQVDGRTLLDYNWDYIIAHELVHQWFGNLVTCESWSHLPLNEGFADYGEFLWNSHKYGQDEADYQFLADLEVYLQEAKDKKEALIRTHYDDPDDMFDAHSYQKAARVIHMLRAYVGDEAFFESLSKYLHTYAWNAVEIEHLRLVFEEVTGEDLNWFFDQWFFTPGHPILEVKHRHELDTLYINVHQQQDLNLGTVYRLPIYVDVFLDGKSFRYPLSIENELEEYRIPVNKKPELVLVDGDGLLLAEINHTKAPSELIFQYLNAPRFTAKYEALVKLESVAPTNEIVAVMQEALSDPFFRFREFAIDYFTSNPSLVNENIEQQILLALSDSASTVRISALTFVGDNSYQKHKQRVYNALSDSSYAVLGNALAIILENDLEVFNKVIGQYLHINDINVILPIAASKLSSTNQLDWFISKAVRLRSSELYIFLPFLNTYLLGATTDERQKSVEYLVKLIEKHSSTMVKFYAYQGLMLLTDLPGISDTIQKLYNNETDKELIELMEGLESN